MIQSHTQIGPQSGFTERTRATGSCLSVAKNSIRLRNQQLGQTGLWHLFRPKQTALRNRNRIATPCLDAQSGPGPLRAAACPNSNHGSRSSVRTNCAESPQVIANTVRSTRHNHPTAISFIFNQLPPAPTQAKSLQLSQAMLNHRNLPRRQVYHKSAY